MQGERTDEQAARHPHRPCATADSGGAVLPPEVDDLWHISQHGDRDSSDAEDLEHGHSVTAKAPT
jgi:hypothetical protein